MPRADNLSYFALEKPLSDSYIFTMLGRVIPLDQLKDPLRGKIRPRFPKAASTETKGEIRHPSNSQLRADASIADSASAVTEVGTLGSRSGEHDNGHEMDSPIPDLPQLGVDLLKLESGLYPEKAVVCRNINILKHKTVGVKAKAAVENMLNLYTNYENASESKVSANGFRRIDVPNPQDQFEELLRHPEYLSQIMELLKQQKSGKAALIISILTCTDLTKSQKSLQSWGLGGKIQNPGLQQGQPVPAVEVEGDGNVTTHEELSGTYEGEVIMACSYLKLQLVAAPPEQQGLWYKIAHAFRSFRSKQPKKDDKIDVSPTNLSPTEGALYLPSAPIKGNIPVMFGEIGGQEREDESYRTAQKEDLAFAIYA